MAMTYYGLILNRIYRVVVTERSVCGARVRGALKSLAGVNPHHQDPEFYVDPRLQARYRQVDPESEAFLSTDKANFRIARASIERVEHVERKRWGMGAVPSSGRIVLHLKDGRRRELFLLGRQNGAAIARSLAGEPGPTG